MQRFRKFLVPFAGSTQRRGRQRVRNGLRDDLRVGAREAIGERPPGRLDVEIDVRERNAVGVFDREGLAGLADAQR